MARRKDGVKRIFLRCRFAPFQIARSGSSRLDEPTRCARDQKRRCRSDHPSYELSIARPPAYFRGFSSSLRADAGSSRTYFHHPFIAIQLDSQRSACHSTRCAACIHELFRHGNSAIGFDFRRRYSSRFRPTRVRMDTNGSSPLHKYNLLLHAPPGRARAGREHQRGHSGNESW